MYNFSNEAKTRIIEGKITRAYLRVLATDTLPEIRINEENYLKDIQFEDFRYVPDEGIIGGTVAKKVTVNFANVDENFTIQDREFELYIGVELENETVEYQKYGTFIVQKPENDQVNDNTYCEALDYIIKFNQPYVDRITYPCTLKQLFNDVVNQAGMQTNLVTFDNDDFIVEDNQFEEGTTLRDVLKAIAQVAFNWIVVDENNYVTMDFEIKDTVDETLDIDNYFNLSKQDEYGPINMIVFKDSQIEGQEEIIRDAESISEYGENELAIVDNPFAYTQEKREQLIEAGRKMFGFRYVPVTLDAIGYIYLNRKDKIRIETLNEQQLDTYILNHTINYNGVALDSIESPAETKTESKYQYESNDDLKNRISKTEIIVDKHNQVIESVASTVDGQNEKISKITQTVDEINSKISDIANTTVSAESMYASVGLENVNESEPITISIHPTSTNISYLYPRNNLYPSDLQFLPDRKIRFTNLKEYTRTSDIYYTAYKNYYSYDSINDEYNLLEAGIDYTIGSTILGTIYENTHIDYELPDNLLVYDNETYDEFYLNYSDDDIDKICQIVKRCGYNADGTVYALQNEIITNYPFPTIPLTEGDYVVSLLGYDNAYLFVRLMASNIYTTQFPTRVEMNTAINQKANEINLRVNEKVDETDFTSANIMLMINNDESESQINADKISLAGKTINLGADNINISSNNFNVDSNGNLTASNVNISGKITSTSGIIGGFTIASNKLYNGKPSLDDNSTGVYIGTNGIALGANSAFKVTNAGILTCKNAILTDVSLIGENVSLFIGESEDTYQYAYLDRKLFEISDGDRSYCNITNRGVITTTGSITCGAGLYVNNASIQSTYTYRTTGSAAPNLLVYDTGNFRRSTSSSKRYKTDITDNIEERLNPKKLYNLPIKQFKYKKDYLSKDDKRYNQNILGFIVEDIAEIYEPAVDYNTDGTPEMWNYKVMEPAILMLIQDLNNRMKKIEGGNK